MFDILNQGTYRIIHLTDGELLSEAVNWIDNGNADGINLNYIRNWRKDLEPLRNSKSIKSLTINDYPSSRQYDYSAVQSLTNLKHLAIHTTDKKEIDFSMFPELTSVALTWRPKAKSLFQCLQLQRLFLNRYNGQDLHELSQLKNLKYLRINLGSIVSLSGLEQIERLEELMLMQVTKLENIDAINSLIHLKRLRIDNCKNVKNISAVKAMKIPALEIAGTTPDK